MKVVPVYWDEELECISPRKLEEIRTLKMQKHLRYAYQHSAFYREAFDRAGFRPEEINTLEEFRANVPLLTLEHLIQHQRANPPFGNLLAIGLKDVNRIYCGPGPLSIAFSVSDMDDFLNITANGLYVCGARRGDIVNVTSAYQRQLAGTMLDDAFRRLGCAVVPGGPGNAQGHIRMMKTIGVTIIFAFYPFAMELLQTARRMGINPRKDLKVRLIVIISELYSDEDKQQLADAFGAEVREMYGYAETGFVAAECADGGGLHCFSTSLVEVVDPETGLNVREREGGEIVTTDLSRQAMPLIRFRSGDLTPGLNLDPCPCGRTSPRLKRITGRTTVIPRVKGTHLVPEVIQEIIEKHENLGKFQIVFDRAGFRDSVTLRVETQRGYLEPAAKKQLILELRAVTLLTMELAILPVGSISSGEPLVIDNRFSQDAQ